MSPKTRAAKKKAVPTKTPSLPTPYEEEPATIWQKYKDDLPNAFNGDIDPQLDFISRLPPETLDHIASFLLLDHEPERAIRMMEQPVGRPHALLSFAAMSRKLYYSTESASSRLLRVNKDKFQWVESSPSCPEETTTLRRSARIAAIPNAMQSERVIYRQVLFRCLRSHCSTCGKRVWGPPTIMANMVCVCTACEEAYVSPGGTMTLTQALKDFDLRDFQLLKSRKPGPRAKPIDHLPVIPYSVLIRNLGFPPYSKVKTYYFRRQDVKRIAQLVHGDVKEHMKEKIAQRTGRQDKARRARIRKAMLAHHQNLLETSKGSAAKFHAKRLSRYQDEDWKEDRRHERDTWNCPDICGHCLDVRVRPGLADTECMHCSADFYDKRYDDFYSGKHRKVESAGGVGD